MADANEWALRRAIVPAKEPNIPLPGGTTAPKMNVMPAMPAESPYMPAHMLERFDKLDDHFDEIAADRSASEKLILDAIASLATQLKDATDLLKDAHDVHAEQMLSNLEKSIAKLGLNMKLAPGKEKQVNEYSPQTRNLPSAKSTTMTPKGRVQLPVPESGIAATPHSWDASKSIDTLSMGFTGAFTELPEEKTYDNGNPLGFESQRRKMKSHLNTLKAYREKISTSTYVVKKAHKLGGPFRKGIEFMSHSVRLEDDRAHHVEDRLGYAAEKTLGMLLGHSRLELVCETNWFTVISFLLILINAVWIAYSANRSMVNLVADGSPNRRSWYSIVDALFTLAFLVELIIRIAAYRVRFFIDEDWLMNWFDFFVVLISSLHQIKVVAMNATLLRIVRLLRVLRMLRAIRSLTIFAELQHYLSTFLSSFRTFLWGLCMIIFITFMCSLGVMELVLERADKGEIDVRAGFDEHYGSLGTSMLTFYYFVTNGKPWGEIIKQHGNEDSWSRFIVSLYVTLIIFMMYPIIIGEYVLKVLEVRSSDSMLRLQQRMEEADYFVVDLFQRSKRAGFSLNYEFDVKGMDAFMKLEPIETFLVANEIELVAEEVFRIFDADGSGTISVKDFVYGCQWLKTSSKPTDTIFLSEQLTHIANDMYSQRDKMKAVQRNIVEMKIMMQQVMGQDSSSV
jgi:voltage-gated sodium channel